MSENRRNPVRLYFVDIFAVKQVLEALQKKGPVYARSAFPHNEAVHGKQLFLLIE